MQRWRRRIPVFLATACLAGPLPAQEPAAPAAPPASAPEEAGEVFLFNDSGPTLIAGNQNVTANGKRVASLPRKTWARLVFPPGPVLLRTDPFLWKQEVALTVRAGSKHYVVVAYRPERSWAAPFGGAPLLLREIGEAEATPLFGEMKAQ